MRSASQQRKRSQHLSASPPAVGGTSWERSPRRAVPLPKNQGPTIAEPPEERPCPRGGPSSHAAQVQARRGLRQDQRYLQAPPGPGTDRRKRCERDCRRRTGHRAGGRVSGQPDRGGEHGRRHRSRLGRSGVRRAGTQDPVACHPTDGRRLGQRSRRAAKHSRVDCNRRRHRDRRRSALFTNSTRPARQLSHRLLAVRDGATTNIQSKEGIHPARLS